MHNILEEKHYRSSDSLVWQELSIQTEVLSEPHRMPQEALTSVSSLARLKQEADRETSEQGSYYDTPP